MIRFMRTSQAPCSTACSGLSACLFVGALLSLCIAATQAFAWGSEGHRIIGTIASANFDDATAKAVRELLGEVSVADACCWADEIRNDSQYDWIKPLHYINVPRKAERVEMSRDGADGQQIISTIIKQRDILKDAKASKEERLLALRLLLHMVGDIHQPLHVSYKDDLGGNKLTLQAFGRKSNLHRAWDTDLIQRRLKDTKGGWPVMSADLRQAITDEQRAQWSKSLEPIAWANESLTITRRVYANMPKAPDDIDDGYYRQWMPTVDERLQAAGIRLAVLLNAALSSTTPRADGEPEAAPPPAAPASDAPDGESKPASPKESKTPRNAERKPPARSSRGSPSISPISSISPMSSISQWSRMILDETERRHPVDGSIACTAGRLR